MAKKRGAYGEKMIKVGIHFWTDHLPEGADKKTAWKGGTIYLYKNDTKGIKPDLIRFSDINKDFMERLFKLMNKQSIKLIDVPKQNFVIVNK